jgi:hypothetical protein
MGLAVMAIAGTIMALFFALSAPAMAANGDLDPQVQALLSAIAAQKSAPAVETIAVPVPADNSINIDDLIAAIQSE